MKWWAWYIMPADIKGMEAPASPPMEVEAKSSYDAKRKFFDATIRTVSEQTSLNSLVRNIRVRRVKED